MEKMVAEILGDGNQARQVVLTDGTKLDADMVLVGVGVKPSNNVTASTQIKLDHQGAIVCNEFMQTTEPDIFAAGDNVSYPYHPLGRHLRIEHYITAMD